MIKILSNEKFIFLFLLLVYLVTLILMPFGLDESLYILTGKMILNGRLNPFTINYNNPFKWIFGSPLVPIIYGMFYLLGGYYFVRIISTMFIFLTMILTYKLTKKIFDIKSTKVALILAGISNTTVLLASDALLDSVAIFFFVSAIYLIYEKKFFLTGITLSLSILCKFFVVFPAVFLILYLLKKKTNILLLLIGSLIVLLPFSLFYYKISSELFEYFKLQSNLISIRTNIIHLSIAFIYSLPIPFFIVLLNPKEKFVKKHYILLIPFLVVVVFHILTLNFMSLHHHIAYGLIPISIIAGKILLKYRKMFLFLLIILVLNLWIIAGKILILPSYTPIINDIKNMQGKILAENPNVIHLIKGTDLNDEYVYKFSYFDYDNDGKSTEQDYKEAIGKGYFDYIIIPSDLTWAFKVRNIEPIIIDYYCTNSSFNGFQNKAIIFTPC